MPAGGQARSQLPPSLVGDPQPGPTARPLRNRKRARGPQDTRRPHRHGQPTQWMNLLLQEGKGSASRKPPGVVADRSPTHRICGRGFDLGQQGHHSNGRPRPEDAETQSEALAR